MPTKTDQSNPPIKFKFLRQALESKKQEIWVTAVNACNKISLDVTDFNYCTHNISNPHVRLLILSLCHYGYGYSEENFYGLTYHPDTMIRKMAWRMYKGHISAKFIEESILEEKDHSVIKEIVKTCQRVDIPETTIKRWFAGGNIPPAKLSDFCEAAIYASSEKDIPYKKYAQIYYNFSWSTSLEQAIVYVLQKKNPPPEQFKNFVKAYGLKTTVKIYTGRTDILPYLEKIFMKGKNAEDRIIAAKACKGIVVQLQTIYKWYETKQTAAQVAAMYASIGRRYAPVKTIMEARESTDYEVRTAAKIASMCIPRLPPVRDQEINKEHLYIKCIGDVYAEVIVPESGHICHGKYNRTNTYYTNEIKVVDIIGHFYGDKVGITDEECTWFLRRGRHYVATDFNPYDKAGNHGFKICLNKSDIPGYRGEA